MNTIKRCGLALAAVFVFSATAFAGECRMTVTRAACPGHEETCYSKCGGKPACDEVKKVGSAEACAKEALRNCTVFRPGETKSKAITASYDGTPVEGGKNFCDPVQPDFGFDTCK